MKRIFINAKTQDTRSLDTTNIHIQKKKLLRKDRTSFLEERDDY